MKTRKFPIDLGSVCWLAVASLTLAVVAVALAVLLEIHLVPAMGVTFFAISLNLSTVPALLAILLGIAAHVQIRESAGSLLGRGLATTGLMIGIVVFFLFLLRNL